MFTVFLQTNGFRRCAGLFSSIVTFKGRAPRAGSLRPVILVTFTNVIPMARRASRLSDRWLLSRL